MTFHEQNIEAFIQLLQTQRSLFSDQDRASLNKLVTTLPDDTEKISEAIASWYEQRSKIVDAQLDILNTLLTTELNASRTVSNLDNEDDKDYRQKLISAIETSAGRRR